MEKILRLALVFLFVVISSLSTLAKENGTVKKRFNWHPVMNAIIQVESEGNPQAVKGKSCGAMQISPIMVEECNQILEKRNSKKRFTLEDRFNVQRSKEMFILIQLHYNPDNNVEKAIRSWNGGQRYSVKATQRYYNKVMKLLK
ncbi:MAG: lytic transglycosylase domain-containing protein [Prevotella sp.]|nr:lytic transglycosylase domain-containing protein [Prevotella sp.]